MHDYLYCGSYKLPLSYPHVMGILNLTPDSFSDGGQLFDGNVQREAVLDRAVAMLEAGATLLDIGGESTRPGAAKVTSAQEIDRVMPALETLLPLGVPLSIDTSNPELIKLALTAGAAMINDVRALTRPGAVEAVANSEAAVCLMHMQGQPQTMQSAPSYSDVVHEVQHFLQARVQVCARAGIASSRIVLDPGFGFGKTLEQNVVLFERLQEIGSKNTPVLVGVSRKSMIGAILDRKAPEQRLAGGLALALLAVQRGAKIIRTHDVAETVDVIRMLRALQEISKQ